MLKIEQLTKNFGGLRALNRCSFEVKQGTITGLIGPNGAGKTTLFNVITGFFYPDGGQISFLGSRIDRLPPNKIFSKSLYRTFQIPREFGQMTVLENLMLIPAGQKGEYIFYNWLAPKRVRKQEAEIRDKALDVLEFVELIDLKDDYAGSLSGGQKKLLELAKSLMADPKIVLLDEPGAGVNPTLMNKLVDNIRKSCELRNITFFLIEHDMDMVMNLCDPIIVMSEGQKLTEGPPEEIKRDPRVLEAYLGGQYL